MMKFVLQGWCQNIVASPVLEQLIGKEKVRFLPPMFVDQVLEKEYARVTDWCIVGNMTMIKRCAWAIEAFRQVPDSQLTIYGNLPDGYSQKDLPSNVHYAAFHFVTASSSLVTPLASTNFPYCPLAVSSTR